MRTPESSWDKWDRVSRFRKALAIAVWAIAMVSLPYVAYLYLDYGARMPAEPQPATGRVHAFDYKGRTLYTTEGERRRFNAAEYVFGLSWFSGVLTFLVLGRRSRPRAA